MSDWADGYAIGPGTELDGFVIEAIAGRGGMGVVYRARQKRPSRVVAIKVIAFDLADDPAFRARFQRESTIAAEIEHPNVIPVYSVGEAKGVLYIAMRFVQGTDMSALLSTEGRLEPRRAATIVDQVAQALDAAHAHGLVHRDVKPANILMSTIGGRDHIYLTDFGLSRYVHGGLGMTAVGDLVGTIDYIAPEQARGDQVDARTDVYSLGCVLFHSLTGTVPFPMENDVAKLYVRDMQPPPSALERFPDLPPAFDTVLKCAMAKEPDDRYPTAGDLGRAALEAAAGTPLRRPARDVASAGVALPGEESVPPAPTTPDPTPAAPTVKAGEARTVLEQPEPARPRPRPRTAHRRGMIGGAIVTAALAAAIGIVIALAAGGGSSPATLTSSSSSAGTSIAPTVTTPVVGIPLDNTSTCTDWRNASSSSKQGYAGDQGGTINGTDVLDYLSTTCSDFLGNTSHDPQIGDIMNYLRNTGDTSKPPCNRDPSSTLPNC